MSSLLDRGSRRRTPDLRGEPEPLEQHDQIPAEVDLYRAPAELRRIRLGVVIGVPALSLEELHEAEPDEVLRRVLAVFAARPHVGDAVDEALPVQRVDEPDRSEPEERRRSERKTAEERKNHHDDLHAGPETVLRLVEIGAPAAQRNPAGLPQPAQMRPPEAADPGTGDVLRRFHARVMLAMVGRPARGSAGAAEHREKDEEMADHAMELQRLVGDGAVIADGDADAAEPRDGEPHQQDAPPRPGEEDEADQSEDVNRNDVQQGLPLAGRRLPPGNVPRLTAETGENGSIHKLWTPFSL